MAAEGLPVDRVSNVLIPASRIMRERDDYKTAWAQEFTRANQLEREANVQRQAAEDWRWISSHNSALAADNAIAKAKAEAQASQLVAENVRLLAKIESLHARCTEAERRLNLWIDDALENLDSGTLAFIAAGPLGVECSKCGGEGHVETFDDVWIPGAGHTTRDYTVECPVCEGAKRWLR